MMLAAALALAAPDAVAPPHEQPLDLSRVCVSGDAVAAELLRSRLAERGAEGQDCTVTIRLAASPRMGAEAFAIDRRGHTLTIRARSTRGLVYGAGWILGHADGLMLAFDSAVREAPQQAVRGTQIGYRPKNNSYDAWTPAMLARQIEDFALWGANRIQIIAPRSDDAPTSPVMPIPPEQAVVAMAHAAHRLGLDVAIFYPLLGDYDGAAVDAAEAARLAALLATLPAVDALYLPGGDPGHTPPARLFPLAERLAGVLRARFPRAELLLSTQGFDAGALDAVFADLARGPRWLTGIFVGPQTRLSAAGHVEKLGKRYPVELYPDTAHAMQAQLPIADWHPAFALIEGREPVNPRPVGMAAAFRHMAPGTRGAVSYSEGVNDDWNVHQWLAMGWNADVAASTIAQFYARSYIGDPAFAAIAERLEAGWHGDPAGNPGIDATLTAIDALRPARWAGWRVDLYRYRAVQDALVRAHWQRARARQAEALYVLRQAPAIGADAAAAGAAHAFARPETQHSQSLMRRLFELGDRLRATAGMQLSVTRHGASHWRRGANLDRASVALDDRVAVSRAIAAAMTLPDENARTRALAAIGDPWGMSALVMYDDLGDPGNEPHLVRGPGSLADPQAWASAVDGINEHSPDEDWRLAEVTYAEALFEHPLTLRYTGLEASRSFRLRYARGGEDYALPLTLTANGVPLPVPPVRTENPQIVDVVIPRALTASGRLDLVWQRPPGIGGGGRGRQIAEVWLIPEPFTGHSAFPPNTTGDSRP